MTVQDIAVVYLCGVHMFCYFRQNDVDPLFTCYNKYTLITTYSTLSSQNNQRHQYPQYHHETTCWWHFIGRCVLTGQRKGLRMLRHWLQYCHTSCRIIILWRNIYNATVHSKAESERERKSTSIPASTRRKTIHISNLL